MARPTVDILFEVRLRRYGIDARGGRNTGRLVLAAELPASVLADLTGISISTAEGWSQWARRDWAAYVGKRVADGHEDADSRKRQPRSSPGSARSTSAGARKRSTATRCLGCSPSSPTGPAS
ncbi:MAG TPA: hypothetical protein VGI58_18340 [Streptosporangiaceae bacterium]